MKQTKFKLDTIVEVWWYDTLSIAEWKSEKEACKLQPAICQSIGYFLNSDDISIRISGSIGKDVESGKERCLIVIPLGTVFKIRKIGK